MSKAKIKKNLSDADMMKGYVEEDTFSEKMLAHEKETKKPVIHSTANDKDAFYRQFLTETLETQIGKFLLDIKLEYFKEGNGAFSIQVKKVGKQIILETAPKKVK